MKTAMRVLRAVATNQVARFAPRYYLMATGQTGRGDSALESPRQAADYFERCFFEYFEQLGVDRAHIPGYLAGKVVLEYGPGDMPGVALLMRAHGAAKVYCVDRFPMLSLTARNREIVRLMRHGLNEQRAVAFDASFATAGDPDSGLHKARIEYLVTPSGLSHLEAAADLIVSRAVLEHVNDLPATFADMQRALRPAAKAVHQVDLKSHGLHRHNRLDFLTWSSGMWGLMYSHKGVPNRWRIDRYREILEQTGLAVEKLEPTLLASVGEVNEVRPLLATQFCALPTEDLRWLGFWLVCRRS
jgi:hypothetical protein